MMAWSSCDLSADNASDQASWQAYIALTLSSIERTIRLPKKSILIIRDRISRFTENVICVKETDTHDLRAEEEETEIENVIWDGEALLDAEIFNVNGYGAHGMMLLRNRFFKTCAFNTNLQDWFFDNDITQVSRLAGYTTARDIKDIKLVITESSVKYFKFMPKDMPFEEKCKRFLDALYEGNNNSAFGVVKADHDAPLMDGMMAYTNYQLLNTIGLTREVFGDYIDIYDMTQAVEDGAIRPVYYESRVIHLKLNQDTLRRIDATYDALEQMSDSATIEKSKKMFGKGKGSK